MAKALETPIESKQIQTAIQITSFTNNREGKSCEIKYMTLLDDGTPFKRGQIIISGYDAVKAFYAEMDLKLSEGLAFEEASRQLLYDKVVSNVSTK